MMTKEAGAIRPTWGSTVSCAQRSARFSRSHAVLGNVEAGTALIDRHPADAIHHQTIWPSCSRARPLRRRSPGRLPKVLELAKRPNAVIKVSAPAQLSKEPIPSRTSGTRSPRVRRLGFDRCLWAPMDPRIRGRQLRTGVEPFRLTDR